MNRLIAFCHSLPRLRPFLEDILVSGCKKADKVTAKNDGSADGIA